VGFRGVALAALQIPVDQRADGQQNLAHGVGEAPLELRRNPVAQGGQQPEEQLELATGQAARLVVGGRLLPASRRHTGPIPAAGGIAGRGRGIAEQPLGCSCGSVQALLETAERIRVGVRTLSHRT
jgi:hypothetical protein